MPAFSYDTPDGRKELAIFLDRAIESGHRQKGGLPERWARQEAMAKQRPTDEGSGLDEAFPPRTFPLISATCDQLVGMVAGPVLGASPWFTAIGYGDNKEPAKRAQAATQFDLQIASWDRKFRQGVRRSFASDPAIYYTYFENTPEDGRVQFCIEVKHPKDFILYPGYKEIKDAQVVGHRYYERLGDIRQGAAAEVYYPEALEIKSGSVAPEGDNRTGDDSHNAGPRSRPLEENQGEDQPVECYLIFVKLSPPDKKKRAKLDSSIRPDLTGEGWIQIRYARATKTILSVEPFGATIQRMGEEPYYIPYLQPGYFEGRLQEREEDEFYNEVQAAFKLQQLQISFDKMLNIMLDGTEMTSAPPVFATGMLGADKVIQYEANSLTTLQGDVKMFVMPTTFKPEAIPGILQSLKELGEEASRLSAAGRGGEFASGTTATAAQGYLQYQAAGLDEYRANATQGPCEMCEWMMDVRKLNFPAFISFYGADYPVQDPGELEGHYTFEPTGKTVESTPQAIVEKLKFLMQVCQGLVQNQLISPSILITLLKSIVTALNLPIETHEIEAALQPPAPMLPGPGGAGPVNGGAPGEPGAAGPAGIPPEAIEGLLRTVAGGG